MRKKEEKKKVDIYAERKNESEKETHACMKARSRLIINSSMPLVELG
jgi:hypothetical protein